MSFSNPFNLLHDPKQSPVKPFNSREHNGFASQLEHVLWFESPEWHRTLTKVLKRIRGVSYAIYAEQGMAYIRGRVDPNKLLKKLSKRGKHADICWVETGNMNPYMHNGYQYPLPAGGYPQPGPGYHPGYHPGYASQLLSEETIPLLVYGYGCDPRSYEFPAWA